MVGTLILMWQGRLAKSNWTNVQKLEISDSTISANKLSSRQAVIGMADFYVFIFWGDAKS